MREMKNSVAFCFNSKLTGFLIGIPRENPVRVPGLGAYFTTERNPGSLSLFTRITNPSGAGSSSFDSKLPQKSILIDDRA